VPPERCTQDGAPLRGRAASQHPDGLAPKRPVSRPTRPTTERAELPAGSASALAAGSSCAPPGYRDPEGHRVPDRDSRVTCPFRPDDGTSLRQEQLPFPAARTDLRWLRAVTVGDSAAR